MASTTKNKGITIGIIYFDKDTVVCDKESSKSMATSIPKKVPTKVPSI